jgi:hypothetical protein
MAIIIQKNTVINENNTISLPPFVQEVLGWDKKMGKSQPGTPLRVWLDEKAGRIYIERGNNAGDNLPENGSEN